MSGTYLGGLKARATIRKEYGDDFFKRIGALGGKNSKRGGFASDKVGADGLTGRQRAAKVGVLGGQRSRRGSQRYVELAKRLNSQ